MNKKLIYTIDEVLSQVVPHDAKVGKRYVDFDGDLIKMESQRYRLFKRDGCICVNCGLEGTYFKKTLNQDKITYHFNLYAIKNGNEMLMTKDHIIAKANGGKNNMLNYQVMCFECNHAKGKK